MVGPASLRAGEPFKERSPIEAGASTLGYEPGRERKQPMSIKVFQPPIASLLLGRRWRPVVVWNRVRDGTT